MGFAIFLLLAGTGVFVLLQRPARAEGAATLSIFTGSVQVERGGSTAFALGHTGDILRGGDTVLTGPSSKSMISYPDGSLTRLDAGTQLTVRSVARASGGGWGMDSYQASGKTWNRVVQLVGGGSFRVSGPNSSTAEVRGTEFSMLIEMSNGKPVVRVDDWSGAVDVSAQNVRVSLLGGQSSSVRPSQPPSAPAPIPPGDRLDSWTVFNQTADGAGAGGGAPAAMSSSTLSPGQSAPVQTGSAGDGQSDLEFTLGWPGSTFELTVYDPDGQVYDRQSSGTPSVGIYVPKARPGTWSYSVRDIESWPGEIWWVIVSRVNPSRLDPQPVFATNACD
ncbi:MAG TPA: FecR domain-containing protein, partial [Candidatus Acidoferrales bacterium]|nr:FecR domain-containing protein [Candidatus Acidoferrales bacterium]